MENEQRKYWFFGSKLNSVLLLILIILMVIALKWMNEDKNKYFSNMSKDEEKWAKSENRAYENYYKKQTNTWINSPTEFGSIVSYPANWQITPQYYGSAAMQAVGEKSLVGYSFTLLSGATITWGEAQGGCSDSDFEEFKYGTSTTTCLKSLRTYIGHASAREVLSSEDLKLFGDFVLKNK